jgi:hypothetical protein
MINLKNIAESVKREVEMAARLMDEFAVSVAPGRTTFSYPEIGCFGTEEESIKEVGPAREGHQRNQSGRQMLQNSPVPFISRHSEFIEPIEVEDEDDQD